MASLSAKFTPRQRSIAPQNLHLLPPLRPFRSLFLPHFPFPFPHPKSQVIRHFLGDGIARSAPPHVASLDLYAVCTSCESRTGSACALSKLSCALRTHLPACFALIQDTFRNFLAFFDEMRPSVRMRFLDNSIAFLKRSKILTRGAGFVTESLIILDDWQLSLNAGSL